MAAILSAHENLLQEAATNAVPLPQNCALQLLFNVRFLSKVLTLREDQEVIRSLVIGGRHVRIIHM